MFRVKAEETCPQVDMKLYGDVAANENWKYLAKYCFSSQNGKFEYDISYEANFGTLNLGLYYGKSDQWDRVYGNNSDLKTCKEKISVLKVNRKNSFDFLVYYNLEQNVSP